MAKRKVTAYLVVADTSVRKSADPASPDWDNWLFYPAGTVAAEWPEHADVAGWLESGHWVPASDAPVEEASDGEG